MVNKLKRLSARTPSEAITAGNSNLYLHPCTNINQKDWKLIGQKAKFIGRKVISPPHESGFTPYIDLGSVIDYFHSEKEGYFGVEHTALPRDETSMYVGCIERVPESQMEKILAQLER